jgi:predicted permease
VTEVNNYPFFEQLRDHNQSFAGLLAVNPNQWKVTLNGESEIVAGQVVTGNYFSVLGVNSVLGRILTLDDDKVPRGHPVAVISYAYWQRRFGKDPEVLGKTITINLTPFTIIGVTSPEFFGLQAGRSAEISVPMAMHSLVGSGAKLSERKFWWNLPILGRLKPGVRLDQARAELDLLQQRFLDEGGMDSDPRKDFFARVELMPAQRGLGELRKQFSSPLQVLMGIVGIVLLIACANVANLLLARATVRQKEISIRLALGASRLRLIRQLLTESVLLALLGGGLGLLFAYWGAQFLLSFSPPQDTPLTLQLSPDARILGFTAGVSLLTGILFGLAPAWRATRVQLNATLKDKAHNFGWSQARLGFGKVLIVSQIALSLMLLVAAGLFVRSLQKLRQVETGFNNWDHILLFSIDCYGTAYSGPKLSALHQELLDKMNALPGVRSASLSTATPIRGGVDSTRLFVSGAAPRSENEDIKVSVVAPRYFETMGMPLVAGRDFGPQDGEQSPKVTVVSESMARHYFPNENPLGRRFSLTTQKANEEREIIGVVKDAKFTSLRTENAPIVYLSHQQDWTRPSITFALRTTGDPTALITAVRHTIQSVGKDIPLTGIRTLATQMNEVLAQERLVATLSGFFGMLALLLACIGLYGLMAYAVTRRTNEIGIRMALGARGRDVLQLIMRETVLLVLPGVVLGLSAAVTTTRLISRMLFGLSATDPVTLMAAALLLIVVAAFAGYLPAHRAAKVNPMEALRHE